MVWVCEWCGCVSSVGMCVCSEGRVVAIKMIRRRNIVLTNTIRKEVLQIR